MDSETSQISSDHQPTSEEESLEMLRAKLMDRSRAILKLVYGSIYPPLIYRRPASVESDDIGRRTQPVFVVRGIDVDDFQSELLETIGILPAPPYEAFLHDQMLQFDPEAFLPAQKLQASDGGGVLPNSDEHIIKIQLENLVLDIPKEEPIGIYDGNLTNTFLATAGQGSFSFVGYLLTSSSSSQAQAQLHFAVAGNAVGFIAILTATLLRHKKPWAAGILEKLGCVAAASGIIMMMGMFLPEKVMWMSWVACLFPTFAVAFAAY